MRFIILLIIIFLVGSACSEKVSVTNESGSTQHDFDEPTAEILEKWSRSCALCHVNGEGGAPRMGDLAAWDSRIETGNARLMAHTLEGYNRMPPLGYCMDCTESDFAAMIGMMAGRH